MIIFNEQKNQLCNRVFSLLPSAAYSIENDEKLVVLFFSKKYLELFPNLRSTDRIRFLFLCRGVFPKGPLKLFYYVVKGIANNCTINRKKFSFHEISNNKNRILFVKGWKERLAPSYITNHYLTIKELFEPTAEVREPIDKCFDKNDSIIIGVHIRRKDYSTFYDGTYFYDNNVYFSFMKQIYELLLSTGKKIEFLICSDEPFPVDAGSEYPLIELPVSDAISDLYALSLCDYIIGPPSTFSQWASFMGRVPLKFITDQNEEISLSDFSYIISLDTFNKEYNETEMLKTITCN